MKLNIRNIPAALCLLMISGFGLLSCQQKPKPVHLIVQDKAAKRNLDSAQVVLYRYFGEDARSPIDTGYTDKNGALTLKVLPEKGYHYLAEATRKHYKESLNENGADFEHRKEVYPGDTSHIVLYLEGLVEPDPTRYAQLQARTAVGDVVAAIPSNGWRWTLLPSLTWEDIPALLAIGGDTTQIEKYPHNSGSSLHPAKVRAGLVALWLVEAIRRQEAGTAMGTLTPPSKMPVLGTKKGAPRINSPAQVAQAHAAYRLWWESASVNTDRKAAAKSSPLKDSGLGWM
ncbi:MAG: DUF4943 domain-containing protein [Bacteroidetes bacterium]|nr:MAG: DUF4943 domain-containing protein [Bacteroidota bacterium]